MRRTAFGAPPSLEDIAAMRMPLRRLLLVPAAFLVVLGAPAFASGPAQLPVPTNREFALSAPGEAASPGWEHQIAVNANLVGITWAGDPGATFTIHAHHRGGGPDAGVTNVTLNGADDTAPDVGSPDAAHAQPRPNATEPTWLGDVDWVRVRVESGSARDVMLAVVQSAPPHVPGDAAGALGTVLGDDASDRRLFGGLALAVGALAGAIALGWSPWRGRGRVIIAAVVGGLALSACFPAPPPPNLVAQPSIVPRSSWGPDLAWACTDPIEIAPALQYSVVHHTVNSNSYQPGDSVPMIRAIWSYHVQTLGYCDIAYNFIVDRYGVNFEGRQGGIAQAVVGAHTGGFNKGSTGVALLGTYSTVQPPAAQWDSLVRLLAWKLSINYLNPNFSVTVTVGPGNNKYPEGTQVTFPSTIIGHRDASLTECPGDAFYPQLPYLRAAVTNVINSS